MSYEHVEIERRVSALEERFDRFNAWAEQRIKHANEQYKKAQDEHLQLFQEHTNLVNQHLRAEETTPRLTLREDIAIRLKIPESGTEWIDAMIRKARESLTVETVVVPQGLQSDLAGPGTTCGGCNEDD